MECVFTSANEMPPDCTLLKIGVPEVQVQAIQRDGPPDGGNRSWCSRETRGDGKLHKKDTALLRIRSAILPETVNFLLNPDAADSG